MVVSFEAPPAPNRTSPTIPPLQLALPNEQNEDPEPQEQQQQQQQQEERPASPKVPKSEQKKSEKGAKRNAKNASQKAKADENKEDDFMKNIAELMKADSGEVMPWEEESGAAGEKQGENGQQQNMEVDDENGEAPCGGRPPKRPRLGRLDGVEGAEA